MPMMTAFQDLPGPSRTFPEPCQLVNMISEPCSHLHQTRLIIGAPEAPLEPLHLWGSITSSSTTLSFPPERFDDKTLKWKKDLPQNSEEGADVTLGSPCWEQKAPSKKPSFPSESSGIWNLVLPPPKKGIKDGNRPTGM